MKKLIKKLNNTTFLQPVNDDWRDVLEVEVGDFGQYQNGLKKTLIN